MDKQPGLEQIMSSVISEKIDSFLNERNKKNSLRKLKKLEKITSKIYRYNNLEVIDFSSNDYLALSEEKSLKYEAEKWLKKFGTSFSASRLVSGNVKEILDLEKKIAEWKNTESAIIIGSGFLANSSVIPALISRKGVIFADKLNHASLNHGCIQSQAEFKRYKHLDYSHLEWMLRNSQTPEKLIVSDSIFSMDGDYADIKKLYELSKKYNAFLYIDDAHATGVFGKYGEGSEISFIDDLSNFIIMGTFSKGMGAYGAYIAGTKKNIDFIINSCSSFIYSTSLPPSVYGSISGAIDAVQRNDIREKVKQVLEMAEILRLKLKEMNFNTGNSSTQIIPIILGNNLSTLKLSEKLLKKDSILYRFVHQLSLKILQG